MNKAEQHQFEFRFPTKKAWVIADAAIDALGGDSPIGQCIDTWIRVYKEAGGVVRQNKR